MNDIGFRKNGCQDIGFKNGFKQGFGRFGFFWIWILHLCHSLNNTNIQPAPDPVKRINAPFYFFGIYLLNRKFTIALFY